MFFYFLFILLIYIHFKIIKATFLIFPLFPSRCVSPLLSLTGAPRGSWSCYPCAKTSGMVTLQRGDTPGKGWKMRNVMFMVGKWKKMEKVFVAFVHLEVLILYILDMFWYVYFKYVLQCLAYVFISFATVFFESSFWTTFWMYCAHSFRVLECVAKICKYYVLLHYLCFFLNAIFTRFSSWQLHRLHVIRPHRCRPSTVGGFQKDQNV